MFTPKNKLLCLLGWQPTGDLGGLTGYTSKRGKPVWFLKAPPTTPPSPWQTHQRNLFRLLGTAWSQIGPDARARWLAASHAARLNIGGYNLFTYYYLTADRAAIATVERQSRIQLLNPE